MLIPLDHLVRSRSILMPRPRAANWRRTAFLVALFLSGLAAAWLGLIFTQQGLERADQLASVIGVFIGLVGLAVATYGAWLARMALLAERRGARVASKRATMPPDGPSAEGRQTQYITAEAPGATAQGAMFGSIHNYGGPPDDVSAPATGTGADGEARDGQQ
jgi:hypothetical protein